jgi:serine/threonine protein phosphatase 1
VSTARAFAIGDIHGCIDEVERLLDALRLTANDTVCFLGDYVDRGPSARAVIARLIRLRDEGPHCIFLKGNHEDMFLGFLGHEGRYGDAFLGNGGGATLASYGLEDLSGPEVAERLPPDHREFLLALRSQSQLGAHFLCVHAGLRPTRPLDDQSDEDRLWIRDEFINAPHPFPYTVLYGHTPRREVGWDLPFKVGLDTGLVYGNRLSCLDVASQELWQIERGAAHVEHCSVADEFAAARPGAA